MALGKAHLPVLVDTEELDLAKAKDKRVQLLIWPNSTTKTKAHSSESN